MSGPPDLQELDLRLRREMTRGMGAIAELAPGVAGPRGKNCPSPGGFRATGR